MPTPPLSNLRMFLDLLCKEKELIEVGAEVDPDQELAEIHRRVIAANGPALLFTRVKGSSFPVVTNLFGNRRRVELAFGREPQRLIQRLAGLVQMGHPPGIKDLWSNRDLAWTFFRLGTRKVSRPPILDHQMSPPDLNQLPMLKTWPQDGGFFLTLPLVLTQDPLHRTPNLGMYRMQRYDQTRMGIHWQIGKGGGFHYRTAEERGESLPVSVFLGGPPALILSTICPLPEGVPEILLTGPLLGQKLKVARNGNWHHPIPAESEFALLGEVPPQERHPEGPFGDHYGYLSLQHDYPVFHCRTLLHRKDAIYPATVVGKPRQEDFYLGDYLQEMLSPLFPIVMPSVCSLWSYGETGFHSLSAAVVKERYRREAMVSAFRILGEGQLSLTKFLMLTDSRIDLKDFRGFLEHILARCRWETDLYLFSNLSMDTLDYTGPRVNEGSKGVLMGLGEPVRDLPGEWSRGLPGGCRKIHVYCPGCLVVEGPAYKEDELFADRLAKDTSLRDWQLVVLVDDADRAARSTINFLWMTFTRFEPARDLYPHQSQLVRNHLSFQPPVVLDARMKPWYPPELFVDPEVGKIVERRWKEYFGNQPVEMGDSARGHLDQ